MKEWLRSIADRVNTTGDPPATLADAVDLLAAIGAPYQAGTVGDVIACLIERCEQLQAEFYRLSRIEAALPKTADGVTIVPGMEVWANIGDIEPWHCGVVSIHVSEEYDLTVRDGDGEEDEANTDDCYSSREAAKKARKA